MTSVEILTCKLCKNLFRKPIVLQCSHFACLPCVTQLIGEKSSIECPTCGKITEAKDGIMNLPRDYILESAIYQIRLLQTKQQYITPGTEENTYQKNQSMKMCSVHSDQNKMLVCMDCGDYCCEQCTSTTHNNHRIRDLRLAQVEFDEFLYEGKAKLNWNQRQCMKNKTFLEESKRQMLEKLNRFELSVRENEAVLIARIHEVCEEKIKVAKEQINQKLFEIDEQLPLVQDVLNKIEVIGQPNQSIQSKQEFKKLTEQIDRIKEPKAYGEVNMHIDFSQLNSQVDRFATSDIWAPPFDFEWDTAKKASRVKVEGKVYEVQRGSSFGTALGNQPLKPGYIYHWKLKILGGTELKIGVSKMQTEFNRAFADSAGGWSFYNYCGELRHDSGGSGPKYGNKLKVGDVLGITCDTIRGTLSFSGNGQDWGVAYTEKEKFCDGDLYPAIAGLSTGDKAEIIECKILN